MARMWHGPAQVTHPDEQEPLNYLVAKQEQQPCEVVVLSLVSNQPKIHIESLAGAGIPKHPDLAHRPDDPISVNAEHRMERAVQNLKMIGCQASGIISYEALLTAVRSETQGHDYNEVILATGRQEGSGLARIVGRAPVQQLRREWRAADRVSGGPSSGAIELGEPRSAIPLPARRVSGTTSDRAGTRRSPRGASSQ